MKLLLNSVAIFSLVGFQALAQGHNHTPTPAPAVATAPTAAAACLVGVAFEIMLSSMLVATITGFPR